MNKIPSPAYNLYYFELKGKNSIEFYTHSKNFKELLEVYNKNEDIYNPLAKNFLKKYLQ